MNNFRQFELRLAILRWNAFSRFFGRNFGKSTFSKTNLNLLVFTKICESFYWNWIFISMKLHNISWNQFFGKKLISRNFSVRLSIPGIVCRAAPHFNPHELDFCLLRIFLNLLKEICILTMNSNHHSNTYSHK